MNASELRIGNLFLEKNSKTEIKVLQLSENEIVFEGDFKGQWQAEPIPLTEDWLLRFGFKHTGNGFYINIKSKIDLCNIGDKYFNLGFKNISIGNIKYVHQLQNLYFALTNTELS